MYLKHFSYERKELKIPKLLMEATLKDRYNSEQRKVSKAVSNYIMEC